MTSNVDLSKIPAPQPRNDAPARQALPPTPAGPVDCIDVATRPSLSTSAPPRPGPEAPGACRGGPPALTARQDYLLAGFRRQWRDQAGDAPAADRQRLVDGLVSALGLNLRQGLDALPANERAAIRPFLPNGYR